MKFINRVDEATIQYDEGTITIYQVHFHLPRF